MFADISTFLVLSRSMVLCVLGFFGPVFGAVFERAPEESTKNISVVRSTESFRHSPPLLPTQRFAEQIEKEYTHPTCEGFSKLYQRGIASWYGPGFHGRQMANGAIYDMRALTVAHRKLPFGTRVCIQNPENGKAVYATVTDRGPYIDGRVIDLSQKVAEVLGITLRGTAYVSILL